LIHLKFETVIYKGIVIHYKVRIKVACLIVGNRRWIDKNLIGNIALRIIVRIIERDRHRSSLLDIEVSVLVDANRLYASFIKVFIDSYSTTADLIRLHLISPSRSKSAVRKADHINSFI